MTDKIHIEKVGRIIANPRSVSLGWFIEVRPEGGGFIILFSQDPKFAKGDVFDDFAIDEDELSVRLRGWQIEWLD